MPPSAGGIEAEDKGKTDKLLEQVRSKYLDKVAEVDCLVTEKNELNIQFDRKEKELIDKIHEKDRQLKVLRSSHSHISLPPTGSFDDESRECDDSRSVLELETALQTKDKEIQSLTVQLQTFQQVATQRKQLQEHSKTQSAVVVNLKKELEAAQVSIKMFIAFIFYFL